MSYVWGGVLNGDIAKLGVRGGFLFFSEQAAGVGEGEYHQHLPPSIPLTNLQEHSSAPYKKHMDTQTICQHIMLQRIQGKPVAQFERCCPLKQIHFIHTYPMDRCVTVKLQAYQCFIDKVCFSVGGCLPPSTGGFSKGYFTSLSTFQTQKS